MAIGLSRLFGIVLPLNFHSPYKSINIIEFWRRWHMTLSQFLRDYLYIPLGGNRKGSFRRYINLFITMLLGGLWHGAGWTYVLWGSLHGCYLIINHGWQLICKRWNINLPFKSMNTLSVLITFIAVVVAWVVFRSNNISTALTIIKSMAGLNGFVLPDVWLPKWGRFGQWLVEHGVHFGNTHGLFKASEINWIIVSMFIVWLAPNSQQIMSKFKPALNLPQEDTKPKWLLWQPSYVWVVASAICTALSILSISEISEFIYYQF